MFNSDDEKQARMFIDVEKPTYMYIDVEKPTNIDIHELGNDTTFYSIVKMTANGIYEKNLYTVNHDDVVIATFTI